MVRWLIANEDRDLPHPTDLAELLVARPAWHQRARCRGLGPAAFFLDDNPLVALCADCPVLAECGGYADHHPELLGVWAGHARHGDDSELVPAPLPADGECGTRKAYRAHKAAGEPPCAQCRASETARVSAYRDARRAERRAS